MKFNKIAFRQICLILIFTVLSACKFSGTESGNPPKSPSDPIPVPVNFDLIASGYTSALTSFHICPVRVEFRQNSQSINTASFEFLSPQWIALDSLGTNLGVVELLTGTYGHMRIILSDNCGGSGGGANSVSVQNGNGLFSSSQALEVNFEGTVTLTETTTEILLNIQDVTDFMATINSQADLETGLGNNPGTF